MSNRSPHGVAIVKTTILEQAAQRIVARLLDVAGNTIPIDQESISHAGSRVIRPRLTVYHPQKHFEVMASYLRGIEATGGQKCFASNHQ